MSKKIDNVLFGFVLVFIAFGVYLLSLPVQPNFKVENSAVSPYSISSDPVYIVHGTNRYHKPGCYFLDGYPNLLELPEDQARYMGYIMCGHCCR